MIQTAPTNGRPAAHLDPPFAVATAPRALPNRVLLHATEGFGKTSFGAFAPSPIFLCTKGEDGLNTLMQSGRLPPTPHFPAPACTLSDVRQCLANLVNHDHAYRTLVIDTFNGVERIIHESVCREHFGGDFSDNGFLGYARGPRIAIHDVLDILRTLDQLRHKGMSILLLCHTVVTPYRNPEGPDYDRYTPALDIKTTWAELQRWADIILFGARSTTVLTARKKDTKGKAQGGTDRVLYTERTAAYDAKNRHGLPPTIQCGADPQAAWSNFVNHLKRTA